MYQLEKEDELLRSDELLRDKDSLVTSLEDEIKNLIDETENIEERMLEAIKGEERGKAEEDRVVQDLHKKEEERKRMMIENERLKLEIKDIKLTNEKEINRLIQNENKAIQKVTFRDFLDDSLKAEKQKNDEISFKERAEELLHQQKEQEVIMQKNIQEKNRLEETAKLTLISANQNTSTDVVGATNQPPPLAADMERQTRCDMFAHTWIHTFKHLHMNIHLYIHIFV
jgi:hypothetical protein